MFVSVGTVIDDKYEVLSILGAGGFGTVYRVKQLQLDRVVALKMINATMLDEQGVSRFMREAKILSSIQHRNLPRFLGFGVWNACPYLVMDFLEGSDLEELLAKGGKLSVKRSLGILRQVCEGLACAHVNGIVHRDLKPSNIFLTQGETGEEIAKVIDFGLAKVLPQSALESQQLTDVNIALGTVFYMSPEQCLMRPIDKRVDIYAMGCILYRCLTGSHVFDGANDIEVMINHAQSRPPSIRGGDQSSAAVCDQLNAIIGKCLAKNPGDRYQTTEELTGDIDAVSVPVQDLTLGVDSDQTSLGKAPRKFAPHQKSHLYRVLVGAVVSLVVVGFYFCVLRPLTAAELVFNAAQRFGCYRVFSVYVPEWCLVLIHGTSGPESIIFLQRLHEWSLRQPDSDPGTIGDAARTLAARKIQNRSDADDTLRRAFAVLGARSDALTKANDYRGAHRLLEEILRTLGASLTYGDHRLYSDYAFSINRKMAEVELHLGRPERAFILYKANVAMSSTDPAADNFSVLNTMTRYCANCGFVNESFKYSIEMARLVESRDSPDLQYVELMRSAIDLVVLSRGNVPLGDQQKESARELVQIISDIASKKSQATFNPQLRLAHCAYVLSKKLGERKQSAVDQDRIYSLLTAARLWTDRDYLMYQREALASVANARKFEASPVAGERGSDIVAHAYTQLLLAEAWTNFDDLTKAKSLLQQCCLTLPKIKDNNALKPFIVYLIATEYSEIGDYADACLYYELAASKAKLKLGETSLTSSALYYLAFNEYWRGDFDKAIAHCRQGLPYFESIKDWRLCFQLGELLTRLSLQRRDFSTYDAGMAMMEKSYRQLLQTISYEKEICSYKGMLHAEEAEAKGLQGKAESGIRDIREAIEIVKQEIPEPGPYHLAQVYDKQAALQVQLHDLSGATESVHLALACWKKWIDDDKWAIKALREDYNAVSIYLMGEIASARNDRAQAIHYYEQSIPMLERMRMYPRQLEQARRQLALLKEKQRP